MKTTLFWDYDGVICDSWHIVFTLWKSILANRGVVLTEDIARASFDGFAWQNLEQLGAHPEDKITYSTKEVDAYKDPEMVPSVFAGMKQIVAQCATQYKMCVITNNQTAVVQDHLQSHGLLDLFLEVQGREFSGDKSDRIAVLCQKHDLTVPESYFITDTTGDIIEARKTNMEVIAVDWGVQSFTHLQKQNPEYLCTNPSELSQILLS